jgi:hypothetical protein
MPLQEPPVTCRPLVNCLPEQKLMKLALSLVLLVNWTFQPRVIYLRS